MRIVYGSPLSFFHSSLRDFMVPIGSSAFACKGIDISNIAAYNKIGQNLFAQECKECQKSMAAIPPSAFSAAKIRETQRNMKISNVKKGNESTKFFNTNLLELTPLKYISKMMNSIWGSYNRYSPHNVKKINDAFSFNAELRSSAANSANKSEAKLTLATANLENVWSTINVSQSH